MDEILQNLIPLSEGEIISKPYSKNDSYKTKWKILERKFNRQKILKNYENIAMGLYWIGKESSDKKFAKLVSPHLVAISRKVYAFAKGNKEILQNCKRVKL
jgi:hypothetical protein